MAGSRIFRSIVPTLLGLLFLAWLPASAASGPEDPFLFQAEEILSLSDLSDQGEPDGDGWSDGEDGPDPWCRSATADGLVCGPTGSNFRRGEPKAVHFAGLPGSRRATGPPLRRS